MSLGRVVESSKVRVAVVKAPSIPFGWKVIPRTADAASVTLRVNLERLNIHITLNRSVTYMEAEGVNGQDLSICVSPPPHPWIHTSQFHSTNHNRFVGLSCNGRLRVRACVCVVEGGHCWGFKLQES